MLFRSHACVHSSGWCPNPRGVTTPSGPRTRPHSMQAIARQVGANARYAKRASSAPNSNSNITGTATSNWLNGSGVGVTIAPTIKATTTT